MNIYFNFVFIIKSNQFQILFGHSLTKLSTSIFSGAGVFFARMLSLVFLFL